MKVVKVQFVPWDKIYLYNPLNLELEKGDRAIVKTDLGSEIVWVIGFDEIDEAKYLLSENKPSLFDNISVPSPEKTAPASEATADEAAPKIKNEIKPVLRAATIHDLEKLPKADERQKAMEFFIKAKEKYNLPMKVIDVHFSLDGSRITFAFIADGRVDFRDMVKELTRHFGRTIRLQQIGIRDEAKHMGDYGHCGKILCCKSFLPEFTSITSEMADLQQCSHRGSERISGICGRLMCCLYYEQVGYENLIHNLPAVGSNFSYKGKKGVVVGQHILKQSIEVRFKNGNNDEETVVEIDLKRK